MLSLCAIVKNEQEYIEQMLASVRGLADQLLVVDTGSTDDTRARAAASGAEVIDYDWCDDFADARNFSLSRAREPWVLILDADEALDASSINTVRDLLYGSPQIYWTHRRHYCAHASAVSHLVVEPEHPAALRGARSFFETHDIRLFPNHPKIRFSGAVHETVEDTAARAGFLPVDTDIRINHFGHLRPQQQREHKAAQYLALAKKKVMASPDDWRTWHQLGIELQARQLHAEAISNFQRALSLLSDYGPLWRDTALSLYALGQKQDSLDCLRKAANYKPTCLLTWSALGTILLEEGQLYEAEQCLNVVAIAQPDNGFVRSQLERIASLRSK